jgi:nucleoid-associated protein YgaU
MSGRRCPKAVAWVAGLGAAAAVLQWTGGGELAAPSLTEPGRWADWLEARDPIVAAFGILRLVALGGLWYLAIVTLVGASLRMLGAASLVRVTDRLTIGPVRRMLAGTMSLGLAASGVLAVAAPALRAPVSAATQASEPSTTTTSTVPTSTTAVAPATVTMHRLGPLETAQPPAVGSASETVKATAPPADQWTVKPGECFWSIADSVLSDRWGRPATDAEIVPYWQRLIDANRQHLVQRDNPDLVLPGQVFAVPAP